MSTSKRMNVSSACTDAQSVVVVELPNPPLQLHPNYSASWQARAMWRKHARQLAMGCAYNVRPATPFGECRARADFRFTQIRRRDGDNLQAWLKAYADGLTDAAIWQDDSLVTWEPPTVTVDPAVKPGVTITVWEGAD